MHPQAPPPRIAIGLPVYNGERYLEETLDTVFRQTYSDFALIISDNASTDRTEEICRAYANKDPRTNYIRNPVNLGASQNYRRCFDSARSEYFRWQNADDPIELTLLEHCKKTLDQSPDVVLAYGKSKIIDEHGAFIEDYEDNLDLGQDRALDRFIACNRNMGLQNLMYGLIRRDQLAKTALLGNYVASDLNLIAELTLYGKFKEVPVHLFNRRMHPQASSWNREDKETQREFWDPSKRKLYMQTWRSSYEYFRAVLRAPIPIRDKGMLSYYQLKSTYWRKESMKNELVDLVKFGWLKRS